MGIIVLHRAVVKVENHHFYGKYGNAMERKRVVALFADIHGSTEFGMRQTPEDYNAMIRAYHRMAHHAVMGYCQQQSLAAGRVFARAVGDECFVLLTGGQHREDECHAMRLAVRLKQGWINSDFGKRLAQAHETGFLGAVTVLGLMGLVIWRITRVASLARDPLGSLICYGVAAVIFFQTFTAVGMNVAVLPVTGLTLPFVSSGGTSLLALLFGVGLVQSVMMRRRSLLM